MEENADLRHTGCAIGTCGSRNLNGSDEVLLTVGTQHADRKLAASEDDGLCQTLEHETERRGCKGHGVCAVQYDKAIKSVVVFIDDVHQLSPPGGIHVARVDGRFEGACGNLDGQLA